MSVQSNKFLNPSINQDQAYRSRRQTQSKALTNLALSFRGATFLIRFTLLYPVISLSLLTLNSAQATQWTGTTSTDWNTAANWDNNVPTSGVNATIDTSNPNAATITTGTAAEGSNLYIGKSGSGTLNLSGGTLSANTYVGYDNSSNGTLNLSGGTLSSSFITISYSGNGTVNLSAGLLSSPTPPT